MLEEVPLIVVGVPATPGVPPQPSTPAKSRIGVKTFAKLRPTRNACCCGTEYIISNLLEFGSLVMPRVSVRENQISRCLHWQLSSSSMYIPYIHL